MVDFVMGGEVEAAEFFEAPVAVVFPDGRDARVLEADDVVLIAVHSLVVGLLEGGDVGVLEGIRR